MAIIKEFFKTRSDGVKLYRTYSDDNRKIIQNETGIVYNEAIDIEEGPYTYTESKEFTYEIGMNIEEVNEKPSYRDIPETIPEALAFSFEERGWWKGELYESLFDNMTWNPEQFAAAWKKVPTDE